MSEIDLIALADCCEAATGPDRDLDAEIAPVRGLRVTQEGHPLGPCCYDASGRIVMLPRYTASLDDALTLRPVGYDWIAGDVNGGFGGTPYACVGSRVEHFAATPALALCAAALRARAAKGIPA